MSAQIHWLASYPKSGNTWLRLLLSQLTGEHAGTADFNAIAGGTIASDRTWIDQALGFPSSELLPDEILDLRPAVYRWSAERASRSQFHKIHDACRKTPSGEWLPCAQASGPGIYLVRNPLDVVLSFSHHLGWDVDKTIGAMGKPGLEMGSDPDGGITLHVPQVLLSWSQHVTSWVDNPDFDMLVVRYEDMLGDPHLSFGRIARHLGLTPSSKELTAAITATRFEQLQSQEEANRFREKPMAATQFFRKGVAGDWQQGLTEHQIGRIVADHRAVMQRFGYCDDAGRPLVG
ncbi:sulfotransferase domain-containing protein [Parerythrobacter aestuarii]|uniref:sulfotransferase domain-containing protein n=1 Tax=Parerythrobacter aestuarii TaxID=3020909 RepID=UPI0024DE9F3B|nr:sulfotransferase domain-containing protein [Parerythrobacter aestuarii]